MQLSSRMRAGFLSDGNELTASTDADAEMERRRQLAEVCAFRASSAMEGSRGSLGLCGNGWFCFPNQSQSALPLIRGSGATTASRALRCTSGRIGSGKDKKLN